MKTTLIPLLAALIPLFAQPIFGFPKIPEEQGANNLKTFGKTFSNLEEWQERANRNREGILKGAGLVPLPKRTPLNPYSHSRKEMDGYSVENVRFESLPGFFVCGNLYRPTAGGPHPAIACPHGHWAGGRAHRNGSQKKRCRGSRVVGAHAPRSQPSALIIL